MSGGNLDIDVVVWSPTNLTVYRELRVQSDQFHFTTTVGGMHNSECLEPFGTHNTIGLVN